MTKKAIKYMALPLSGAPLPNTVVIPLPTLYRTWGAWLKGARTSAATTQKKLIEGSLPYFRARHVSVLNWRMYSSMERDERTPLFEELEPLYRTFAEGYILSFSDIERDLYVKRARERIEANIKKPQHIKQERWNHLADVLAEIDGSRTRIYLLDHDGQKHAPTEEKDSRRLKALVEALRTDTSHLLEREEWVQKMLTYPTMTPQKKLVTIQGHQGTGKSHALALLTQRFAQQSDVYLIPYRFEGGEGKTPEDHLSVFLATILADLIQVATIDEAKQRSLEERIDQVLAALKQQREQEHKVILLLDDVQEIFPSALEWSPVWEQFFQRFIREPHTTTIYIATRTWPEWMDRRRAYLEETDLPELSQDAGMTMWQRFGFTDVPETLIQQVVTRWGSNPHLIEMRASHLKQRPWAFAWGQKGQVKSRTVAESENTTRLKSLLEQDSIFTKTDIEAQKVLQQVISSRLSHPALRILECLAISPLGLPFALLDEEFPHVYEAFDELSRASLTDLRMAAANRAAVAPLVREAQLQALLNDGRYNAIESRVTDLYAHWLNDVQDFRDDAEKSALIAEMVVRYIRSRQPLKAAELFITYGWLCTMFGHVMRIQRVHNEVIKEDRGKEIGVEQEVGRLLLQHRIAISSGQKIERDERDRIYQSIYQRVIIGEIILQSHSELEVLHNMRLLYSRGGKLTEARQMFDQTLTRLQQSRQIVAEVQASFLYEEAQLHLSWSEQHPSEAQHHRQIAENTLRESITQWRLCLKNSLPLQEHYVDFELARALTDNAYVLRELGKYREAQQAIEESIDLKKKNAALPHSIAIAQGELAQILLRQGMIKQSKSISAEAIQLLECAVNDGDHLHKPELGMLLVERADILWEQAELAEALSLLERAVPLLGDKPSRQLYKQTAMKQIDEISLIMSSRHSYQLDRRWFPRYSELVAYDDLFLLTQAGPFTEDEEKEWAQLFPNQDEEESKSRLLELAAQSRKREYFCSLQTNCLPTICYPCILVESVIKDILERLQGLEELRKEIETHEKNTIVRRLYLDAIGEQITFLHLIEAVALKDQEMVWRCNLQLYGKPSEHELKIALQTLYSTISDARHHPLAGPIAQDIIAQLKVWGISLYDFASEELFTSEQTTSHVDRRALIEKKKAFPTTIVRKFFQDVLNAYGAHNWKVEISPARDYTYVDPNERKLVLPQKSFSLGKIRQLLAEEIETHTFRALAGQHSSLALLGLGLARQEATEEGLAKWYVRHVNQQIGAEEKENSWIGTLSSGLASGVLTPTLSFQELRSILEKYYLLHRLLEEEETQEEAITAAKQSAWARACRTFRGVPDLSRKGCCSLKDRIYLRGHLDISRYFERGGDEQRLWVGAIGIEHLEDLGELNILTPNFPHRHFALASDLADRLSQYKE